MAVTTPPTIPLLTGTPPNRGQSEDDFNTNQQNFVDYQVDFSGDVNTLATWMQYAATYAETQANAAEDNADSTAADVITTQAAKTDAQAAAAAAQAAAGLTPDPDFGMVMATQAILNLKTAPFTAAVGETYRIDTSGGGFNFSAPAGMTQGQVFHVIDYSGTFHTNNARLLQSGYKIMGQAKDLLLTTRWARYTFEYAGTTKGLEF